jgi:hypothetical protein
MFRLLAFGGGHRTNEGYAIRPCGLDISRGRPGARRRRDLETAIPDALRVGRHPLASIERTLA